MKRTFLLLTQFIILTWVFLLSTTIHAATLEVGSGKPYTAIQSAINDAGNDDTILVYDGTYVENINFSGKVISVKSVNGAASTIIDGNASGNVVTFDNGEGAGSVLNGFTIKNGYTLDGGGIYSYASSPTIINCTVTGNTANNFGGGIFCGWSSSPTITNCIVTENTVSVYGGGGIYCLDSSPTINSCNITGNTAFNGGGIFCEFSSPVIINCTVTGNTAMNWGGGIACAGSSSAVITNCTVIGNTATSAAGGIACAGSSSAVITNCTFTGNTASDYGGGGIASEDSSVTVVNTILWGNIAPMSKEILLLTGPTIAVTYSDVDEDGYAGTNGNIRQDPLFVDPANENFHLQPNSPCIDAATSDNAPTTDMEGNPRYDDPSMPNTGGGTYPYYDIGAFEYQLSNVVIDGCDSGVKNLMLENGSTMSDMINTCANGAKNHGAFVSCVAKLTNTWEKMELITEEQKEAIQSCAAKASIP